MELLNGLTLDQPGYIIAGIGIITALFWTAIHIGSKPKSETHSTEYYKELAKRTESENEIVREKNKRLGI